MGSPNIYFQPNIVFIGHNPCFSITVDLKLMEVNHGTEKQWIN